MNKTERAPLAEALGLMAQAESYATAYLQDSPNRAVFPSEAALAGLGCLDEALPKAGSDAGETLRLLHDVASPATVASNAPNYYGFVIGATLPVAAAAERLVLAWDQCASSFVNSPAAATLEHVAARWVVEILDLPREAAVGFGTSATACGLACIAAARRHLLARQGWDFDRQGLHGAPVIRVVVSELAHITVLKALRILGFGLDHLITAPVDAQGRIDPERLPELDERTILCLQAGEVNTGSFDPFEPLIAKARKAGTWVHVDGAFGLWARASHTRKPFTAGVGGADSWTCDGHKWLNTPYDGAMAICRDAAALAAAMNADAPYASAEPRAQKNLTLEFSRRARGVAIWAALRTLGRDGVAALVDRHCALAQRLAAGLSDAGLVVLNDVVLNQVLARHPDPQQTQAFMQRAQASGRVWFGPSLWRGEPAFRWSVSSWWTTATHIDQAIEFVEALMVGWSSEPSAPL